MDLQNPYQEDRKPSRGEKETQQANYLVMLFRLLSVDLSSKEDREAVERTAAILQRWWRIKVMRRRQE